jgi:hypothetical protein
MLRHHDGVRHGGREVESDLISVPIVAGGTASHGPLGRASPFLATAEDEKTRAAAPRLDSTGTFTRFCTPLRSFTLPS